MTHNRPDGIVNVEVIHVNSNSKRYSILSSASCIVKNHGIEKLTLEFVASEAGISKGGLLHHFPNKEALFKGMVEMLTNDFGSDVQNRVIQDPIDNGKWSRAYLQSIIEDNEENNGINAEIIAALFKKGLLGELQSQYTFWQKNLGNDGIDPVISTIVRLAADGLWFSEMFGLGKIDDELREKVIQKLLLMTK